MCIKNDKENSVAGKQWEKILQRELLKDAGLNYSSSRDVMRNFKVFSFYFIIMETLLCFKKITLAIDKMNVVWTRVTGSCDADNIKFLIFWS